MGHGPYKIEILSLLQNFKWKHEKHLRPRIKLGHTSTSLEQCYGPRLHFPKATHLLRTIEIDRSMELVEPHALSMPLYVKIMETDI